MKLVTRAQWGARSPKYRNQGDLSAESTAHWNGPKITINGKPTWDHSRCAGLVRGIQNFHMDGRGWSDIAYNYLECPHGYTFEGRGLNRINGANGTNAGNKSSHAICCLAGEGNPFGDEEKRGFRDCVRYISDNTSAPDRCKGHRDWKATACPGDARYHWVRNGMPLTNADFSGWPPFNPEQGQFSLYPFNKTKALIKIGAKGDLVKYLQGVIKHKAGGNISIDGDFGPHTEIRVKDLQRFFKLSDDGIVGMRTWGLVDFISGL